MDLDCYTGSTYTLFHWLILLPVHAFWNVEMCQEDGVCSSPPLIASLSFADNDEF